jgi:tRNA threonylcarbamoyladenosine biosynthesis protein TsaE
MTDMPATIAFDLPDETATAALAARVAARLAPGDVVALTGDLGAGKTAFARAAIRSLAGAEEEVPSPTFTLVQTYELPAFPLWHFDLYRLKSSDEVLELGWDEVRDGGVALVEWPDRLGRLAPNDRLDIRLTITGDGARRAELTGRGSWAGRLEKL